MKTYPRMQVRTAIAPAAALTLFLSGCSGGSQTAAPAAPAASTTSSSGSTAPRAATTSSSSTAPKAANPVATESNPPGDIPDNQLFVGFTPPGTHVTVKTPEGWGRSTTSGDIVFTDKLNSITIHVAPAGSAPSPASVRTADVAALRSSVPKFSVGQVSTVQRAGGSAILLTYQGDSAPNEVTGKVVRDAFERYVYFHAGQRLDLTLSGPVNADNVDPWKTVSESVRWS